MAITVNYGPDLSDYGSAIAHAAQQKESYNRLQEYNQLMMQAQNQQRAQALAAQQQAQQASLARQQLKQQLKIAEMNAPVPDYSPKPSAPNVTMAPASPAAMKQAQQAPPSMEMGGESALSYAGATGGVTITPSKKTTAPKKVISPAAQKLLNKANITKNQNSLNLYERTKNIA